MSVIRVGKAVFWLGVAICVTAAMSIPFTDIHVGDETLTAYDAAVLVVWFGSLLLSLVLLTMRLYRYHRAALSVPSLLYRDIISKMGLAISLSSIFAIRLFLQVQPETTTAPFQSWLPWVILTTVPAMLGMLTFLFFEIFIIDHWQADGP